MKIIRNTFQKIDEEIVQITLKNDFRISFIPKPSFKKTFATITTEFGATDRVFISNNEKVVVPAGTAHFLEHKMFEKPKGDLLAAFSKLGLDTNAFTNQTQTSYLFSGTDNVLKGLEVLLELVNEPYFTKETVQKEMGIIEQEISMYQDEPNWRLYTGMLGAMYPNSPLKDDIAGTSESIHQITDNLLYQVHNAFYQPKNLHLRIATPLSLDSITQVVEHYYEHFDFSEVEVKKINLIDVVESPILESSIYMPIAMKKTILGIRGEQFIDETFALKFQLAMDLAIEMMFGDLTDWYQQHYQEGNLDDSFNVGFEYERNYHYMEFSFEGEEIDQVQQIIENRIEEGPTTFSNKKLFNQVKNQIIGQSVLELNRLESIVNQDREELYDGQTVFDEIDLLSQLTIEEVAKISMEFFKNQKLVQVKVLPLAN